MNARFPFFPLMIQTLFVSTVLVMSMPTATGQDESATTTQWHPLAVEVKNMLGDRSPDKVFVMAVALKTEPGQAEALVSAFAKATPLTRKEPGNLAYLLLRSPTEKDSFVVFERWKSLDDLQKHLEQPYIAELLRALEPVLASSPELTVMHPVFFPKNK